MGRIDDEDDIPTAERLRDERTAGFQGFDWWWNGLRRFTLGLSWSFGEWYGPVGYENGGWTGWHLYVSCLFWGCRLDWNSKFHPNDPDDALPRLGTDRRPRRTRVSTQPE